MSTTTPGIEFRVCVLGGDELPMLDLSIKGFLSESKGKKFEHYMSSATSVCCYTKVPYTQRTFDLWDLSLVEGVILFEYFEKWVGSPSGSAMNKGVTRRVLLAGESRPPGLVEAAIAFLESWADLVKEDDFTPERYREWLGGLGKYAHF